MEKKNTMNESGKRIPPFCSLVTVNYNGLAYLDAFLTSVRRLNYPADRREILVIDNGSTDASLDFVESNFPDAIIIRNENNFAKALNIAVRESRGEFIGMLNNDMELEEAWLTALVDVLVLRSDAGCVGSKILFQDGKTINSVGHEKLQHHYFQDKGFNEEDKGQYDSVAEAEGICGGSVLWRRQCLEDIGPFDEDYIMYFEDVDMSYRCRKKNWKILYTPKSIVYHRFHGTSGERLCFLLCNRNRFFFLARHDPVALPESIKTSHFYLNSEYEFLRQCMPLTIQKLVEHNNIETAKTVIPAMFANLMDFLSPEDVLRTISAFEIKYRGRKPSVCIYDHALHIIGGGQKYAATIASILQHSFDVTYVTNSEINREKLEQWYGIDLGKVAIKTIRLDFYSSQNIDAIDPNAVNVLDYNPFDVISEESAKYDIFINANMTVQVKPMAPYSIFICHFPDSEKSKYFYADKYSLLICNSEYGAYWIRERWGYDIHHIVYPPIDMVPADNDAWKENIILSAARFEVGGSKKQLEMVAAFVDLCNEYPAVKNTWKFILVGGSIKDNVYLQEVIMFIENHKDYPLEVHVNVDLDSLKYFYARSKIFWHACGLNETNPHLIEHFGMTTVEAMQHNCVPVVINGGGQREIVQHGVSGFLFDSLAELKHYTIQVIAEPERLLRMADNAHERSRVFETAKFKEKVQTIFDEILRDFFLVDIRSIQDLKEKWDAWKDLKSSEESHPSVLREINA